MRLFIVSDIHLFLNRRSKTFTSVNVGDDVDTIYNKTTIEYIKESFDISYTIDNNLSVIFLGDIVDNAYIKEYELYVFNELLQHIISYNVNVYIIVGNHDSSSRIPENKLRYSALRHLIKDTKINIITDHLITKIYDNTLVFFSFFEKRKLYDKLIDINKKCSTDLTDSLVFMTHNNFYLTPTFYKTHMFDISTFIHIFNSYNDITFINGHIHNSYYEVNIANDKLNYYQLGSVSPTSFKVNPIASGIMLLDLTNTKNPVIFDNKKLVLLSIDNKDTIPSLCNILDDSLKYNAIIFLRYAEHIEEYIKLLYATYTNIKAFQTI